MAPCREYSPWVLERIATGEVLRLFVGITTIGRMNSGITIPEGYVSRNHGEFHVSSIVEVKDSNSVNGIYVNCVKIAGKVQIVANNTIGIGCMDDTEDDPTLPVYRLKFLPLRFLTSRSNEPVANRASTVQCAGLPAIAPPSRPATSTSNRSVPAVTSRCSTPSIPATSQKSEPTVKMEVVSLISDDEDEAPQKTKAVLDGGTNNSVSDNAGVQSSTTSETAKTNNATKFAGEGCNAAEHLDHEPILPEIKREYIRSTSQNIITIFGEIDDVIIESIKPSNENLYHDLNRRVNKKGLRNGDHINLCSDSEDETAEIVDRLAVEKSVGECVEAEKSKNRPQMNSPDLFDSSNGSENYNEEVIEVQVQRDMVKDTALKVSSIEKDTYENDEDNLHSQNLIDYIKAELVSDDEDNMEPEENATEFSDPVKDDEFVTKMKAEPMDEDMPGSVKSLTSDDCWVIPDDDNEYDEELESRVTHWKNKLLSQTIPMSQVFDIPNETAVEEQEDKDENVVQEEEDDDDMDNLYNYVIDSIFEDPDRLVNDIVATLADIDKREMERREENEAQEREGVTIGTRENIDLIKCEDIDLNDLDDQPTTSIAKHKKISEYKTEKSPKTTPSTIIQGSKDKKLLHDQFNTDKYKEPTASATISSGVLKRLPPTVIDAPQLPKHKGKLRGVSAVHKTKLSSKVIKNKVRTHDSKKWLEKPSESKKHHKRKMEQIQATRKERLKELADKQTVDSNEKTLKRKLSENCEVPWRKAKVKVTEVNRGAFLTKDIKSVAPFKIPKINKSKQPVNTSNKNNTIKETKSIIKKSDDSKVNSCVLDAFAQEINKADEIILERLKTKPGTSRVPDGGKVRAHRPTNKLSFASMDKNYTSTRHNEEMLQELNKYRSCLTNTERRDANKDRVKKRVRFNDTPIVHYIDRVIGATKKVDWKDALLKTPHLNQRRQVMREQYSIVDFTNTIITMMLTWCNEWLVNRNAQLDAATEVLLPMPMQFSSFNHYKSIIFPLMRMEFLSTLEREKKRWENKQFKGTVEQIVPSNERAVLFIKSNNQKIEVVKTDLVILDWSLMSSFAYLVNKRKNGSRGYTLVYEILANDFTMSKLNLGTEMTIIPVIDNLRVEIGAFNSVYQLEQSPLLSKIMNPNELCDYKPPYKNINKKQYFDDLNERQKTVLFSTYEKVMSGTPNITLIQGPPGTGKSCVISNLVLQLLYGNGDRFLDQRVLVCAQSNAAVDVIAQRLYYVSQRMRPDLMFRLIRYGLMDRIHPAARKATLEQIIERGRIRKLQETYKNLKIPGNKNVKEYLKSEMEKLEAKILGIESMKASNVQNTVQEDELLDIRKQLSQMKNIVKGVLRPEDERSLYTWHLGNANVVCATLSSCVKLSQYVDYFDVCIIDEATQCTEPWTLLPLRFGINSLVLVGDTQQLPATVISQKAYDFGLGRSLFTRIENNIEMIEGNADTTSNEWGNNVIFNLNTQYRMHPDICRWPNAYFYKNELINGEKTLKYKAPIMPFSVLNLTFTQNSDCKHGQIFNEQEARFVAKLVKSLDGYIPSKYNSYGVITPYAQQRATLERSLRHAGFGEITVNTIDSYQGTERDVIIISNARTNGVGFLANSQRLNVAITRPKKCLVLCGNFKNLESVPAWRSLLKSARERNVFFEISANCMDDMRRNVISKIKIAPTKNTTCTTKTST